MSTTTTEATVALGRAFLAALAAQDFERLQSMFAAQVRFRALVPAGVRQGQTAAEATNWLRRWFGDADQLQMQQPVTEQVFDRLYVSYRLRLHDAVNGWRLIAQQVYGDVRDGQIADMWLACSGFRRDLEGQQEVAPGSFAADAYYDAGAKGCAEGPLEEIAATMHRLEAGQTLAVHAAAPSVAVDLPAWCRLTGHELVEQNGENYLIRRKGETS
jgi:TusA-related sulfurtransferase